MTHRKKNLYRISLFVSVLFFFSLLNCTGQEEIDPKLTEVWEPVPEIVTPGNGTQPPSDAIILFDGSDLSKWKSEKSSTPTWRVADGVMTAVPDSGGILTKQGFGDCQLHVEFRTPFPAKGEGQDRGNSGVYLQNRYEVQVLDSYDNRTYSNGQAGSIYKQYIPLVNVCRKPGEWQTYDIIFTAPRFNADSSLHTPGFLTVLQNGVLIQNHVELKGTIEYRGQPKYKMHGEKEPVFLQEHGHLVSYRNIWIREL